MLSADLAAAAWRASKHRKPKRDWRAYTDAGQAQQRAESLVAQPARGRPGLCLPIGRETGRAAPAPTTSPSAVRVPHVDSEEVTSDDVTRARATMMTGCARQQGPKSETNLGGAIKDGVWRDEIRAVIYVTALSSGLRQALLRRRSCLACHLPTRQKSRRCAQRARRGQAQRQMSSITTWAPAMAVAPVVS